ncbi:MAG: S-ribosylhomocysteine lyase [Clostridia bacterium]|nr:S-ribosylhomocysteine lyase [Clostridia bacterium]
MEVLKRIASFSVDHNKITEGIYLSRVDGDVYTYDLRTRVPNAGDYMDNVTMHSVEHLFATFVRSSSAGDRVIYFGPMGCRTGFYLLLRDTSGGEALALVKNVLKKILVYDGPMPGASRVECGNYLELDLEKGKEECRRYLAVLESRDFDMSYPA